MAEFKKNNRFGGGAKRSFGGDRRPFSNRPMGGRNRDSAELFDAECNSCHNRCQVPFRPNVTKPVYCRDCFKGEERSAAPRFRRDDTPAPRAAAPDKRVDALVRQIEAMNATLEKLVTTVEALNRGMALAKEVSKHVPAKKPAGAPKSATKRTVKKVSKST